MFNYILLFLAIFVSTFVSVALIIHLLIVCGVLTSFKRFKNEEEE